MGIKTKLAKGPNPLSMPKKMEKTDKVKKRRFRKGKRSRDLSSSKRAG